MNFLYQYCSYHRQLVLAYSIAKINSSLSRHTYPIVSTRSLFSGLGDETLARKLYDTRFFVREAAMLSRYRNQLFGSVGQYEFCPVTSSQTTATKIET